MLHITISLRALVFVLLLGIAVFTGPDVAQGAPSMSELTGDGLLMTNPGQNGARDVHTDSSTTGGNNLGGVRIYTGNTLSNPPTTAALQFYGNGHTVFGGQAFIDSGALNTAAIIFRTAPSGGVAERLRITADGRVGIGTSTPNEQLQITGNLRLPATTATTGIIRSGTDTLLHTFGSGNFFAGINAGNLTTTGSQNTVTGMNALQNNSTGGGNTASGISALQNNLSGNNNSAFGSNAGGANMSGSNNTFIGRNADAGANNLTNATAIGASAQVGASDSLVLGNNANVGIGTSIPQSKLQVSGGYLQFSAISAGAPLAADCDADAERGRLVVDTTDNRLYVCNGAARGWDFIALTD